MKYDDLFEVVRGALVKCGIESHRIAGDVTRAVVSALDSEAAQHSVQLTGLTVLRCEGCGAIISPEKLCVDCDQPRN